MAVSRLNSAESIRTGTEDPYSFDFTPSGTPRGIIVWVCHPGATPLVTSITYGGVDMRLVAQAFDTATEPGTLQLWFLGKDIPTGLQSVSADLTSASTTDVAFAVVALGGNVDIDVIDLGILENNQANPTVTIESYGRTKLSVAGRFGGLGTAGSGTLASGNTADQSHDFGSTDFNSCYETTVDNEDHVIGWSTLSNDDLAFIAAGFAEVEAVPGYVPLAGGTDSIRTNDQSALDLTADHEVIACVALDDWSPASIQALWSKWQADNAAGLAYAFRVHSASGGIVNPVWWDTGSGAMRELFGSPFPAGGGQWLWIRYQFDADNGSSQVAVTVSYAFAPIDIDPSLIANWKTLSVMTESPAAAVSSNSQPLWLGLRSDTNDPMSGRYYYFELRDGIGGTAVAIMDARETDPTGSDGLGNSWSLNDTTWVAPEETAEPVEIALQVATATLSAQALDLSLGAAEVDLSPATIAASAQALQSDAAEAQIALSPAQATVSAQTLSPVVQPVEVSLAPAVITSSAQALAPERSPVLVSLEPATITSEAAQVFPTGGEVLVDLQVATLTITAQPISPLSPIVVDLDPALLTVSAQVLEPIFPPVSIELEGANMLTRPQVLDVISEPRPPVVIPSGSDVPLIYRKRPRSATKWKRPPSHR